MATSTNVSPHEAFRSYLDARLETVRRVDERLELQRAERRERQRRIADGRLEQRMLDRLMRQAALRAQAERDVLRLGLLRDIYM